MNFCITKIYSGSSNFNYICRYVCSISCGTICISNKFCKLVAIPTTAGTGSEFTHTSVYKTQKNIKTWLWDELTYFDYVIYSPCLTLELPKNITIASGVDALSHLLESLMSLKFDTNNLDLCNL